MNVAILNNAPSRRRVLLASARKHGLATIAVGAMVVAPLASAFAAAAATPSSPAGSLGEQLNTMSSEAINSGSILFGIASYLAATACFFFGVWALWQSRQPQNRETGYVGRGIAGLVLCGLFATGGVWINKAAVSASGATASINDNTNMVQFAAPAAAG